MSWVDDPSIGASRLSRFYWSGRWLPYVAAFVIGYIVGRNF